MSEKDKYINIKSTPKVLARLRVVCALAGEKQYEVLERLLAVEEERLMKLNIQKYAESSATKE